MQQRATSNGYSWWWASHIRTKQSKWLEQNLQDMEGKVEHVLNLIQKDGDSFAKRAEMYYKHRPELINFVEESVRAYRSLAERYDKLSTDLQKANTTIASVCPEKVTYDYDEDEYIDGPPKTPKSVRQNTTKIPKPPKNAPKTIKANPSNDGSLEEENAGTLMAEAVLKSCEETLDMLQEKQEKSSHDAKLQKQRFDESMQKLNFLKHKFNPEQMSNVSNQGDQKEVEPNIKNSFEGVPKNVLTVKELEDTIDKLVNKMVSLESAVSSQTSLNDMLRKEADDLQIQIRNLEKSYESGMVKKDDNIKVTSIEEKLRTIFEENLDLWLRVCAAFRQIHKIKTRVEDLREGVKKVKVKGVAEKSSTMDVRSDIMQIYKHLKDIHNKLAGWLEQRTSLKDELEMRCSNLSKIQEEITQVLREGVEEEEIQFSTHHATKFQGEILKMKQQNNKINEELEAGFDHATSLKLEIEKTLQRLDMEFGLSNNKIQPHKERPILFGVKAKKQKPLLSFFSCISYHKKSSAYKGGCM